jgi:hypothetical protein
MKDYIITVFLFPDIEVEITDNFANNLVKETNATGGSYVTMGSSLVMDIRTRISKEDLFEILDELIYEIGDSFIITEVKDDYSIMLPAGSYNNLFRMGEEFDSVCDDYIDYSYDRSVETEKPCFKTWHSSELKLNLILDKINLSGIESLNKVELKYLENY